MRYRYGGTNAQRHRMLCVRCKAVYDRSYRKGTKGLWSGRFTLKRAPTQYKRGVKCPRCKSTNVRDVEMQRRAETLRQNTCLCNGIPFPHRHASILGCDDHPKAFEDWTQEDEQQYREMLETPRSG